ncbi:hypothetical protein ACVWXQ_000936 [Bradyrhizobium sp. S3.14.4]
MPISSSIDETMMAIHFLSSIWANARAAVPFRAWPASATR